VSLFLKNLHETDAFTTNEPLWATEDFPKHKLQFPGHQMSWVSD